MATFCIPNAPGVPGLSGQPPTWVPGGAYPQRTELDDPRWRGAYRRNFDDGVVFRAVYDETGGQKSLYLSWNAVFVPELDDTHDVLYLGLRASGGADAMVIRIEAHGAPGSATAGAVDAIDVYEWSSGSWSPRATEPTWIAASARLWMEQLYGPLGTEGSFAVQLVVPITTSGGLFDDAGPEIGDDPDVWYYVTGGGGVGPIELIEVPDLSTTTGDLLGNDFPDPAGWDRLSTIPGDAACPTTGGVALQSSDVGTTNSPVSQILYETDPALPKPTNTFVARPRNYTGSPIAIGDIRARFRIANWGSVADPNADWVDIPGGGLVASGSSIPAIAAGNPPPATNPIQFDWQLGNDDIDDFITGSTPHKCILVELDGPNLTFFNESVYRNMDFVEASRFERAAEISIRGLEPTGGTHRDVYLALERLNMPEVVQPRDGEDVVEIPDYGGREDDQPNVRARAAGAKGLTRTVSRKEALDLAKRGLLPPDVIQTFMPTYRVHVYYDTGRTHDGEPVLRPQATYGYFVEHDGPLVGWSDALQAPPDAELKQLRDRFYQIVVPHNGSTVVSTVIEAREDDKKTPGDVGPGCLTALFRLFRS